MNANDAARLNKTFEEALFYNQGPDRFLWNARESQNKKLSPYALDHSRAKEAFADSLRVRRDPCGFCGVRADLHANHGCGRPMS